MDFLPLVLFSSVLIVCAVVTAVVMFSLGRWTWFELIEPRLNRVNYETVMTNSKEVSIVSMPRGGDSLFMAVAHQLNPHSLDMSKRAEKLRLGVCYQLMQGLDKYRTLVLESLGDHCGRYAERKSQDSQILHFLQDLARPGFPGGKESLQAIADMLQVDMMVFVEGGDMDRVKSSAGYIHHTISVVRRRAERGGCRGRFHYDSVYSVSRFVVEMATTPQPS